MAVSSSARIPMAGFALACLFMMATAGTVQAETFRITSVPETTVLAVGEFFSYSIRTNAEPVAVVLEEAPEGMIIDWKDISWTPAEGQNGSHRVVITATASNGYQSSQSFLIEVLPMMEHAIDLVVLSPSPGRAIHRSEDIVIEGLVASGAGPVDLMVRFDNGTARTMAIDGSGGWRMSFRNDLWVGRHVLSVVATDGNGNSSGEAIVVFRVIEDPFPLDTVLIVSTPIMFITMSFGLVSLTEAGRYKLLALFLIPLYTKVKKTEILDHFTRGEIFQYLKSNPGETYTDLKNRFDINNGNLTHHLRLLEEAGYIRSVRNGLFRHFYPSGMAVPSKIFRLSVVQKAIIEAVRQEPGITQTLIAEKTDITGATVNYHLKHLVDADIIRVRRKGVRKRCYLRER